MAILTHISEQGLLGQREVKVRHILNNGIGHHHVCEGSDHTVTVAWARPGGQPPAFLVGVQPAFGNKGKMFKLLIIANHRKMFNDDRYDNIN